MNPGTAHPQPRFGGPPFIGRPLRDLWALFSVELAEALSAHYDGITPATNQVMVLIDLEGTNASELARRAGMTKQSMAEAVAQLERRGLVERRPDPSDRRAKLVLLTEDGRRALAVGRRVVGEMHDRWTALLGERDMARLLTLLDRLRAVLDADAADTT